MSYWSLDLGMLVHSLLRTCQKLQTSEFTEKLSEFNCSPHITFTTNSFYNNPHTDKADISKFAFALFVPTETADGTLVSSSDNYDVSGGRFVFPDYHFCIDFKQRGIVKMIWAANQYKHCTFPTVETPGYTQMAMSLQINKTTTNTSRDLHSGLIFKRKKKIAGPDTKAKAIRPGKRERKGIAVVKDAINLREPNPTQSVKQWRAGTWAPSKVKNKRDNINKVPLTKGMSSQEKARF
ncbi:hypothetical protein PGT21_014936 [Puccinia graminis f. sp. tritici]|uniref:Tet-like 2OG-Fe(II) oxygenase domain-containing protein n=1 Tax=Puccinia graminis f. sp. tritici TaxID=56615 RepID=A0A5B0S9I2_PUCGR|nr:hypothetical protein PGT21_014936 [Puccinia graminis f. sp. tritici]KAA1134452.1 hypothetical protein PGTUg99_001063 [Puccinia graminis f. sp. tritici]